MSIELTRRTLNQLDRELISLEQKLAAETKKEADKTKRINNIEKSITKYTSASSLQSKMRQIQAYQNDLVRIKSTKADLNKKIADKRKRRTDTSMKLQREETAETKRLHNEQESIYANYEKRISELTKQLENKASYTDVEQTHLYQPEEEEHDVFISHASEDKKSFADELHRELVKEDIKVWYDSINIRWGDSLRAKIDSGLKKSKYGIVIISKDYIKKGWTQYELDGLFQREMMGGRIILPIWHNITKKEVQDFSPTLAGRFALNTVLMTPAEMAAELIEILELDKRAKTKSNN